MAIERISKMDTEQLNRLVSVLAEGRDSVDETANDRVVVQLLDQWLKSPVSVHPALLALLRQEAEDVRQGLAATTSLGHLLLDTETKVEALEAISRYTRQLSRYANSESENLVLFVLYWAAIASALAHHSTKLSSDSYENIAESFADLSTEKWMPASMRELFSHATKMSQARRIEGLKNARQDDPGSKSRRVGPRVDTKGSDSQWPTASLNASIERPGSQVSHYKLLDVLGEGGTGIVYRAWQDHPLKRQVALKVIKPGMDSRRVIARFEAERQALALLDHSNIAHIYDAGTTESGRPYFVMEYVEGLPITEHCDHHKLTIENRLRLFYKVCHAVQHAHQKGIIHRDIKPSNILVSLQDSQPVPKIIDFGIAKALTASLTEETFSTEQSLLFGTPEYMSPEQADMAGEGVDTRSDIYSLGVLLYVLLTGVLPYDSEDLREGGVEHVRRIIRETAPKAPSTRLTGLGEQAEKVAESRRMDAAALAKYLHKELEWIPLKAIRKERTERYRSASELADDIENYLSGAPLLAGPPDTFYRFKKFLRQNRTLVSGVGAVLIVLTAGIMASTLFAVGQLRARAEAKALSDFLRHSVLESLDPFMVGGKEISSRSVIDAASKSLEQGFAGAALDEAEIRYTLGNAYWSLGLYEQAESHLRRALDIQQAHLGPEDPATLACAHFLGWVHFLQCRYREAEQLLVQARQTRRRVLGEKHADTVLSTIGLGLVYNGQGRFHEAEQLLDEALETGYRELGDKHPYVPGAMNALACCYELQGRYFEQEQLARQGLGLARPVLGDNHFVMLILKDTLGRTCLALGRYEEAEQLFQQVLKGRQEAWGPEHPDALGTMNSLAWLYHMQGQYEQAESIFVRTMETARVVLGDAHLFTLASMHGLAAVYLSQGRHDEAEQLLDRALEIGRNKLRGKHWAVPKGLNILARLYLAQDRFEEAEQTFRRALESRKDILGEGHPDTLESKNDLAVLYKKQGDYTKAELLLIQAVNGRSLKLGDTHPHTQESLKNLINLYKAWNKPEKAEEWRAKQPDSKE